MSLDKKSNERRCLDIVLKNKPMTAFSKEIYHLISGDAAESESPDFIINNIGLEHFLIDVFFEQKHRNAMSMDRKQHSAIVDKIDYYKGNDAVLDEDIKNGNAPRFIENIINEQLNKERDFRYDRFIQNFNRVYQEHYGKVERYKERCDKIGFLIEIPYKKPFGSHGYVIENNGKKYNQVIHTIPITRDMLKIISLSSKLDFVILCLRPINATGKKNSKEYQIVYIDMKNFDECVKCQNICICDSFDYSEKFESNTPVHLKVESSR